MQDDPLTPLELAFRKAVQTCLRTRDETQRRKTPFARWSAAVRDAWSEKRLTEQSLKPIAGRAKKTRK